MRFKGTFKFYFAFVCIMLLVLATIKMAKHSHDIDSTASARNFQWGEDRCIRCDMKIKDKYFAAQIINPDNKIVYRFDDIGCAVLWLNENHVTWENKAIIWVTDAKSGEWIMAQKALFLDDSITPMAFGFATYSTETLPPKSRPIVYDEINRRIKIIENSR